MYNLKSVFAIISLEENIVKLLVIDKQKKQNNFLFYDSVKVKYDYTLNNIINLSDLRNAIKNLTLKADKVLGFSIKRYMVNIPFLQCDKHECDSNEFCVVGGYSTNDLKSNLINKISLINEHHENKVILFSDITKWILDDVEYEIFPVNKAGNKIKYKYVNYLCEYNCFSFIKSVLENQGFSILAITTNEIVKYCNGTSSININDNETYIYHGNKTYKFNKGFNKVLEDVNTAINYDLNIPDYLDSLMIVNPLKTSVPLVNFYTERYKSFKQLDSISLTNIIEKKYNNLLSEIYESILKNKIHLKEAKVYGNNNICKFHLMNIPCKMENFFYCEKGNDKNIWLNDKNINMLLEAIDFIHEKQKKYNNENEIVYSIDDFENSDVIEQAIIKNITNNLGIITTNWVAKLG
ncbi:MAG: hypothetical protein LBB39_03660 [Mycoplasmataceae bacterium]|nr:hypothetical protein [Mycoplasmataceae bacterium]